MFIFGIGVSIFVDLAGFHCSIETKIASCDELLVTCGVGVSPNLGAYRVLHILLGFGPFLFHLHQIQETSSVAVYFYLVPTLLFFPPTSTLGAAPH